MIASCGGAPLSPTSLSDVRDSFGDALARAVEGSASVPASAAPAASGPRAHIDALVRRAALRYGVDERLIHAVIKHESNYNPTAVSRAGARGLMQLMPENCREFGVADPFNPEQNIDGGVRHLKQMLERFGSVELGLAAYNAGPGAVRRHGGIPPYRETEAYVRNVLRSLREE